jgi:hypothetical protein
VNLFLHGDDARAKKYGDEPIPVSRCLKSKGNNHWSELVANGKRISEMQFKALLFTLE